MNLKEISIAIAVIAGWIGGIASLYGRFFSERAEQEREALKRTDKAEDRLLSIMEKSEAKLEAELKKRDNKISALENKVENLERENQILTKVFQGRNEKINTSIENIEKMDARQQKILESIDTLHHDIRDLIKQLGKDE